jgi:hypothetical protein
MWKRRTPKNIEAIERRNRRSQSRFNPIAPLLIALAATVFLVFMSWAGWRGKFIPWGDPIPLVDALLIFPSAFVMHFVLFYGLRLLGVRLSVPQTPLVICNRCHGIQTRTDEHLCSCGGEFEPLKHWRWFREDRKYVHEPRSTD